MIKNHVVAKDGFEPPIARSELAVLPLHYMASFENCLSSQTGSEINNIYIFQYEKFSILKKCCIIINMSNVCGRGRTQTYISVLATVSYQLNYSPLKIHLFSRTDVVFFLLFNLLFIYV